MNAIETIIQAETPRDVILFLTKNECGISYPRLDGLYNRNNWVNIHNNLELLVLVDHMTQEGLIERSAGIIKRGPNWKEPAFVIEQKYSFE